MTRYDVEATRSQISAAKEFERSNPRKIAFEFTNTWLYAWIAKEYYANYVKRKNNYDGILRTIVGDNDRYVTFNYTPTLADLFNVPRENILYIHNRFPDRKTTKHITAQDLLDEVLESGKKRFKFGSPKNVIDEWIKRVEDLEIKNPESHISKDTIIKDLREIYYCFSKKFEMNEPYYRDLLVPELKDCKWSIYYHGDSSEEKSLLIGMDFARHNLYCGD